MLTETERELLLKRCSCFFFIGFDAQGAEQLGNKLHNTSKWIGATEIAVLLRSLRIRLVPLKCFMK